MYFTRQSQTALAILAACARKPGVSFTARQLAGQIGVPNDYLEKPVTMLLSHALLVRDRGSENGLRLAVDPEDVTLAAVLQLTQPEVATNDQAEKHDGLVRNPNFVALMSVATSHFVRLTERFTLADLAASGRSSLLVPTGGHSANFQPGLST